METSRYHETMTQPEEVSPRALDSLFLVALKKDQPCSMPWQLWESQSWFSPVKCFEIQEKLNMLNHFDIQNKMW